MISRKKKIDRNCFNFFSFLDKELLEAKAEESTQTRLKYASEVSNLLFAIYFRLIKDPAGGKGEAAIITNRALLRPVLTGLAKFGHLMSIDYFQVSFLVYQF